MDIGSIEKALIEKENFREFSEKLIQGENLLIEELWEGPKALLLYLAAKSKNKHLLIITEGKPDNQLFEDLSFYFQKKPTQFPAWESLPGEEIKPSSDVVGERFAALEKIKSESNCKVILAPLKACFEKVVSSNALQDLFYHITKNTRISFEAFVEKLIQLGYVRDTVAAEKGTFAVRGGIVDLFPSSAPEPYRLEFDGDEIVSLRKYDPTSQCSTGKIEKITLAPSDEHRFIAMKEKEGTLFDYLGDDVILVFDDLFAIEENFASLNLGKEQPRHISKEDFFALASHLQKLFFVEGQLEKLSEVKVLKRGSFTEASHLSFQAFGETLSAWRLRHPFLPTQASFCPQSIPFNQFTQEQFLQEVSQFPLAITFLISSESEKSFIENNLPKENIRAKIHYEHGYLSSGFYLKESNLALITGPELTGRFHLRREKLRQYTHALPLELFTLNPGESVVHISSGIGRYLGVERRKNHLGIDTEFLLLEYADGAKLYVPMEQAHLITKYIGSHAETPELHELGSSRWKKTLERSERAIYDYANELIELEAKRAVRGGFAYPEDSMITKQFSDEFPYEETPDQMLAIEAVYHDMKSGKSMDRLVLGDVGYGKTEVAMRAAFKAVADGKKQVAVLVPTTVLAMQHAETFSERMRGFPIRVESLSRFRTQKEIKATVKGLESGEVDIVIGTHRLISSDILFHDLGLIIIDEEQRFGVKAKEHLKQLKAEVDCLTLSATPIPRTLYLSLVGARDMSVINTPPLDRLPIQTLISESTDDVIRTALLRELTRGGQAFVIHNRVESIYELANRIRGLIPEAKIAVGHGQMDAEELDTVFHAFKSGAANILVSTSIIENGIDIHNANTIIIDRADHFGLADLYQMRGRVGRWNRKAFCYFLVNKLHTLSEISRKRLSAIASAPGFGGGMKIAMHDLEIRGAGNILGTEQSGHITSIGFTLYCKLLKKAIHQLKKKSAPLVLSEVKIDLPFDARLPEEYVGEMVLRLEIYQRLGEMESDEEIDELKKEFEDRFGPAPKQVEWLIALAKLRLFAARNRFTRISFLKTTVEAEQNVGHEKKIVKKILFAPLKAPEDLFKKLPLVLEEHFPLPS